MLIHPWDATLGPAKWQDWLASASRFGILAVNNLDPARAPVIVPTHFTLAGGELLLHLARPNPVWPHLEAAAEVRLAVTGDYAYIPTYWRAKAGGPDEDGVPTSYYTAVQFLCRPTLVDDPQGKAEILTAQFADFQPEGGHAAVAVGTAPYGRTLSGIRGIRLAVLRVDARFKCDDHNSVEHRQRVIGRPARAHPAKPGSRRPAEPSRIGSLADPSAALGAEGI
jgi:transcriptional regulator